MSGKKISEMMLLIFMVTGGLAAIMVFYMHSDSQRAGAIAEYLYYKYNMTIDENAGVKITGDEFTLTTEDNIEVCGTCDFFGDVLTESYVNYFYADECVDHIREKIGDCFSDSVIIYDGIKLSELSSLPWETEKINSYDEYVATTKNAWENDQEHKYFYKISIRVYIRESENSESVKDAIARLQDSGEYFDVFFYAVPDELFDIHKEKGTYAYFKGKSLDELDDYLDKETAVGLQELISRQEGLVDEYCSWNR